MQHARKGGLEQQQLLAQLRAALLEALLLGIGAPPVVLRVTCGESRGVADVSDCAHTNSLNINAVTQASDTCLPALETAARPALSQERSTNWLTLPHTCPFNPDTHLLSMEPLSMCWPAGRLDSSSCRLAWRTHWPTGVCSEGAPSPGTCRGCTANQQAQTLNCWLCWAEFEMGCVWQCNSGQHNCWKNKQLLSNEHVADRIQHPHLYNACC